MKVLYDHQMFTMQRIGGISRYYADLLLHLPKGYEFELPIEYSENHYLEELNLYHLKTIPWISNFRIKRRIYYFLNERVTDKVIKKGNFNVFHPSYYDSYFLKEIKKPFIVTVHDMIHEKFPEAVNRFDNTAIHKKKLVERASHIIAVSEFTKSDLIHYLNVDPSKITVVHHGFLSFPNGADQLYSNYILYVGERNRYKNFPRFIHAIAPLLSREKDLKLVCTGKPFSKDELQLFADLKISSQLQQITATDSQIASLYQHALVFVFPSLYEGFGRPTFEAFNYGCPVCLSNASCFPEIAGDAALYFDPMNEDSILDTVSKVIYDKELAKSLIQAGKERLEKHFSFQSEIDNTCKVYSLFS